MTWLVVTTLFLRMLPGVDSSPALDATRRELDRSMSLHIGDQPRPYSIMYRITKSRKALANERKDRNVQSIDRLIS